MHDICSCGIVQFNRNTWNPPVLSFGYWFCLIRYSFSIFPLYRSLLSSGGTCSLLLSFLVARLDSFGPVRFGIFFLYESFLPRVLSISSPPRLSVSVWHVPYERDTMQQCRRADSALQARPPPFLFLCRPTSRRPMGIFPLFFSSLLFCLLIESPPAPFRLIREWAL